MTDLMKVVTEEIGLNNLNETQEWAFKGIVKLCLVEISKNDENTEFRAKYTSKEVDSLVYMPDEMGTLEYKLIDIASYWSNDLANAFLKSLKDGEHEGFLRKLEDKRYDELTILFETVYRVLEEKYGWKW